MPYLNLQITRGATRAQKAQLVAEFTETPARVMGKRPEQWGFAGMLTDEYRKVNS